METRNEVIICLVRIRVRDVKTFPLHYYMSLLFLKFRGFYNDFRFHLRYECRVQELLYMIFRYYEKFKRSILKVYDNVIGKLEFT